MSGRVLRVFRKARRICRDSGKLMMRNGLRGRDHRIPEKIKG